MRLQRMCYKEYPADKGNEYTSMAYNISLATAKVRLKDCCCSHAMSVCNKRNEHSQAHGYTHTRSQLFPPPNTHTIMLLQRNKCSPSFPIFSQLHNRSLQPRPCPSGPKFPPLYFNATSKPKPSSMDQWPSRSQH